METVTRAIAKRLLGERGAAAAEYALLTALLAVAILGTVYVLGGNLASVFNEAAGNLGSPAPGPAPAATATAGPPVANYEDCDAVRAAGADPLHVGDPGYSPALDPDGDGVACD